jgi:subtilisin family serine protease
MAMLVLPATAAAQDKPASPAADGRWIVVYERGSVDSVDRETDARERRRGFRSRVRFKRAIEGFAARLTAEQVRALRADPDVEAVVPDQIVHAFAKQSLAPGEPVPPTGVRRIGLGGQDWVRGPSDVGVAVLDTGVDLQHPDLDVADGKDCVNAGTSADDDNGHGTHVAGTVGARNNGAGVTGVAPGTRIHAVKVLDSTGEGLESMLLCGIDWTIANATSLSIRVINLSLGETNQHNRNCGHVDPDPASTLVDPLHDAICRATAAGLLSVVAAGNDAWNISQPDYDVPASYPEVLTVAAMTDADGAPGRLGTPCEDGVDDTRARYSNFTLSDAQEAGHMVAAPGSCITSTWPLDKPGGGYATHSGTSMATPHAAGLAALCIGEAGSPGPCAGMTPAQIVQRLRADAEGFRRTRPASGFEGDPLEPLGTQYFGFLVRPWGPESTLTSTPVSPTADSTPTFAFSSSTADATFECSLDDGAYSACSSPYTTAELGEGAHKFSTRAVDFAGTPDASAASDSFTVDVPDPPPPPPPPDTTAPVVSYNLASRQRISSVSRNGIRVNVGCSEACSLQSAIVISGKEALRLRLVRRAADVTAGRKNAGLASVRRTFTIRLTSAVRRRLATARSALVRVQIVAMDAAGNARTVKKSIRLVR